MSEIDAQSEVGEIYLRTLLRAQLRLALSILLTLALTIGALPLLFTAAPGLTTHHVFGMPVSWGVLAFGCYPVLVLLAWRYVRLAERNERAFARVVERSS
jgi:putative solute:sodium symporter small subunit